MNKYKRIFTNHVQTVLAFKVNFFSEIFFRALSFLIMIFLWKAVYAQSGDIAGFTFQELMTYFLLVELFRHLLSVSTYEEIMEGVRDGKIANYLLLPLNSMYLFFVRNMAKNIVTMFFFVIPVIGLLYFTDYFVMPSSSVGLLLTVCMVVVAMFTSMFMYTLLGAIAFWTVETGNIIWAFNFIIGFFAGRMIPVQFLPEIVQKFVEYTPFVAIFNLPASIYLGKFSADELVVQFAVQIAWMIGLYLILILVWKKGLRRMELVGG